jgi:hypothetical protein
MLVWWSLRDFDKVYYHLSRSIGQRSGPFNFMLELPVMKGIEADPRIAELIEQVRSKFPS